jgi:hypothetical protein
MDTHRCPQCNALVIDRRFPTCTSCHAALPEEWVMTPEQVAKVTTIDAHARAEHATAMAELEPVSSPDTAPTIPLVEPGLP